MDGKAGGYKESQEASLLSLWNYLAKKWLERIHLLRGIDISHICRMEIQGPDLKTQNLLSTIVLVPLLARQRPVMLTHLERGFSNNQSAEWPTKMLKTRGNNEVRTAIVSYVAPAMRNGCDLKILQVNIVMESCFPMAHGAIICMFIIHSPCSLLINR